MTSKEYVKGVNVTMKKTLDVYRRQRGQVSRDVAVSTVNLINEFRVAMEKMQLAFESAFGAFERLSLVCRISKL